MKEIAQKVRIDATEATAPQLPRRAGRATARLEGRYQSQSSRKQTGRRHSGLAKGRQVERIPSPPPVGCSTAQTDAPAGQAGRRGRDRLLRPRVVGQACLDATDRRPIAHLQPRADDALHLRPFSEHAQAHLRAPPLPAESTTRHHSLRRRDRLRPDR